MTSMRDKEHQIRVMRALQSPNHGLDVNRIAGYAAYQGCLDMVKFCLKLEGVDINLTRIAACAAFSNHMDILNFVVDEMGWKDFNSILVDIFRGSTTDTVPDKVGALIRMAERYNVTLDWNKCMRHAVSRAACEERKDMISLCIQRGANDREGAMKQVNDMEEEWKDLYERGDEMMNTGDLLPNLREFIRSEFEKVVEQR